MKVTLLKPSLNSKNTTRLFKVSLLCLGMTLAACDKKTESQTQQTPAETTIELIQQDLVPISQGTAVESTSFTGTVRAIEQSTIQALVTATATSVNAQVGQNVSKGQVLVRLDNHDNAARLAQARANLSSAQAQAKQAQNMMVRKKRLLDQGFISKVEYEQSQVEYQAQLETVRAQTANVDIAQKATLDGTITSPISGVITQRMVEPGQTVAAGQTLFEVVNPNKLEIHAQLPSDQQMALKVGHQIQYNIQGNPEKLTATLSRISPIADPKSRQIEFFATPLEKITSLSIGAYVDGKILSPNSTSGQKVPLDVIYDIETNPYVYVIRNSKIVKAKVNIISQQYDENVAIISGLNETDLISKIKFTQDDLTKRVVIQK